MIRLQKYLAECGIASRRASEKLITAGKVKVNGEVVSTLGSKIDPHKDIVEVDGKSTKVEEKGIILFHKPVNVISTKKDPEGRPTVADYLGGKYSSYYPVGRLDFDSSGLIIMTNDGELAERLLHPRYGFKRIYEVLVEGSVSDDLINKLARGIELDDGDIRAQIEILESNRDDSLLRVSVAEGRNRIVRRMLDKVGHPVLELKRVEYGPFKLGRLRLEGTVKLTEREYRRIRDLIFR